MEPLVAILAVAGMLAMTAGSGLMVWIFWGASREGFRRSPPTAARMAVRLAAFTLFFAPGITLLIVAPWGSDTDAAVLLGYTAVVVLIVLGLSAYEAWRSRMRLRDTPQRTDF